MNGSILLALNLIIPIISIFIKNRSLVVIADIFLVVVNVGLFFASDDTLVLTKFLNEYYIYLRPEKFAIIFATMVSILNLATKLYSFAYIDLVKNSSIAMDLNEKIHFKFTPIAIMAAINIAYSGNLITLFLFYELLTLATYPLVIQSFSDTARKAGKLYLLTLLGSSSFFLMIALVYLDHKFSSLDFREGGILSLASKKDILILLICFVFGFSKTAIFPFYKWLPRAMVAPIPVSALLHAVAVVKSGIFALIKVFIFIFGYDLLLDIKNYEPILLNWLTILTCFTILFACFKACRQNSLKKILAYSTIAQLSYMILALSFASKEAIEGSFTLLLAHSLAKITLFFLAGIIYISTHKIYYQDMKGIFSKMPLVVILFILASASIIAVPFTPGYIAFDKILAAIDCQNFIGSLAMITIIIGKLLACFYLGRVSLMMIVPSDEVIIVRKKPVKLVIITAGTFILSTAIFYYIYPWLS